MGLSVYYPTMGWSNPAFLECSIYRVAWFEYLKQTKLLPILMSSVCPFLLTSAQQIAPSPPNQRRQVNHVMSKPVMLPTQTSHRPTLRSETMVRQDVHLCVFVGWKWIHKVFTALTDLMFDCCLFDSLIIMSIWDSRGTTKLRLYTLWLHQWSKEKDRGRGRTERKTKIFTLCAQKETQNALDWSTWQI